MPCPHSPAPSLSASAPTRDRKCAGRAHSGVQECRSAGMQRAQMQMCRVQGCSMRECRSVRVQGCRMQGCRVQECRCAGVQGCRGAGVQRYWVAGCRCAHPWAPLSCMGTSICHARLHFTKSQAGQGLEHFFRYVPVAYSFMVKAG